MKKIPIIIDSDTGIDDAVAIAVATYLPQLDVKLITSTYGNASTINTTENNLNLLSYIGKSNIPVAKGADEILSLKTINISAHGATGLGEFAFPERKTTALDIDAVEAMHNVVSSSSKVTFVATGPLTNIATFLKKYPSDKNNISKIILSGGLFEELKANEEPYISFNFAKDSEALEIVLRSGVNIEVVPSNLGHDAHLTWQEVYKTKHLNKTGQMFEKIFRSYKDRHIKNGIACHDLCAAIYLSHPSLYTKTQAKVYTSYDNSNYLAVLKFDFESKDTNAVVVTSVNIKKFKRLYFKTLKKMP